MYVCVRLSDNLWEMSFFSTVWILWGWIQVVRLGNKCFDPGSHPFLNETFFVVRGC